jgi:hypothetical protein
MSNPCAVNQKNALEVARKTDLLLVGEGPSAERISGTALRAQLGHGNPFLFYCSFILF